MLNQVTHKMSAKLAQALSELDELPATLELIRENISDLKDPDAMTKIEELYITAVQDTERQITDIERQMEEGIPDPIVVPSESCDLLRFISKKETPYRKPNFNREIALSICPDRDLINLTRFALIFWPKETVSGFRYWVESAICNERIKLLEFLINSKLIEVKEKPFDLSGLQFICRSLHNYLTPGRDLYDWSIYPLNSEVFRLLLNYIDDHCDSLFDRSELMNSYLWGTWDSENHKIHEYFFQSRIFREYPEKQLFVNFATDHNFPELARVLKDEFDLVIA